jgi:hypothetical protein
MIALSAPRRAPASSSRRQCPPGKMQAGNDSVLVTNEETVKFFCMVTKHKEIQATNRNDRFGGN